MELSRLFQTVVHGAVFGTCGLIMVWAVKSLVLVMKYGLEKND